MVQTTHFLSFFFQWARHPGNLWKLFGSILFWLSFSVFGRTDFPVFFFSFNFEVLWCYNPDVVESVFLFSQQRGWLLWAVTPAGFSPLNSMVSTISVPLLQLPDCFVSVVTINPSRYKTVFSMYSEARFSELKVRNTTEIPPKVRIWSVHVMVVLMVATYNTCHSKPFISSTDSLHLIKHWVVSVCLWTCSFACLEDLERNTLFSGCVVTSS